MSALSDSIEDLRGNERQWRAFTQEGHCVVLAPPGSGKTKLLATRVVSDLRYKIESPRASAAITLTVPAAGELRQRINTLGVEKRSTLFVGTVHAFALRRVVQPFARAAGMADPRSFRIGDISACDKLLQEAITQAFPRGADTQYVDATISRNRRLLATDAEWKKSGEHVRAAAELYQEKLKQHGLIDFDGIVAMAVELVESHDFVRKVLTAQYPFIYVDEYQDLAPGLDRLVRALCFNTDAGSTLFAVGDPDQAIFGWTGTRPELLHELADQLGDAAVRLNVNYRCSEAVIAASVKMLDGARDVTGITAGGCVEAVHAPEGLGHQCVEAAKLINAATAGGTPLHEIAVLCATKEECADSAAFLRAAGIASFVRGPEYRLTSVTMLLEGLAAWTMQERQRSDYDLGRLLRAWRDALGVKWDRRMSEELVSLLLRTDPSVHQPAWTFIEEVLSIGLGVSLSAPSRAEDNEAVAQMSEHLRRSQITLTALADRARKTGRVEVATLPSSKGLEFDVVLILGAEDTRIPHFNSLKKPAQLAEERRKFYVSLTRAREAVYILYSGYTVNKWGRRFNNGPSRFLRELGLVN